MVKLARCLATLTLVVLLLSASAYSSYAQGLNSVFAKDTILTGIITQDGDYNSFFIPTELKAEMAIQPSLEESIRAYLHVTTEDGLLDVTYILNGTAGKQNKDGSIPIDFELQRVKERKKGIPIIPAKYKTNFYKDQKKLTGTWSYTDDKKNSVNGILVLEVVMKEDEKK